MWPKGIVRRRQNTAETEGYSAERCQSLTQCVSPSRSLVKAFGKVDEKLVEPQLALFIVIAAAAGQTGLMICHVIVSHSLLPVSCMRNGNIR